MLSHQQLLKQDGALHGGDHLGFGAATIQAEGGDGIHFEKVAKSLTGKVGTAIVELAKVVFPMMGKIFR